MKKLEPKLLSIKPNKDFTLDLLYDDSISGKLEIHKILEDEQFSELDKWEYFKTVTIDDRTNDIVWDNGATLCKNASYRILSLKSFMGRLGFDPEMLD